MGYEKSEKEDGDACQEVNACSGETEDRETGSLLM